MKLSAYIGSNASSRTEWLAKTLGKIPEGRRILDAGAGELRNKPLCKHLDYVSQDFCQYDGEGDKSGLQAGLWDTSRIDIVSDITSIPEPDGSFDAVLCSEVIEHIPDPFKAIQEFHRVLKQGGVLILTAPFASFVHFAPYHYATGFSRYWYEYHLPKVGFRIVELTPNGDWFAYLAQELMRLPAMAQKCIDWCWPLSYVISGLALGYLVLRGRKIGCTSDLACFGWHCIAEKHS